MLQAMYLRREAQRQFGLAIGANRLQHIQQTEAGLGGQQVWY